MPLHLYNLFKWHPLQSDELLIFSKRPRRESEWVQLHHSECLKLFLPLAERDQKGNLLSKVTFLDSVVYVRVLVVTNHIKVEIFGSKQLLVIVGLIEVLACPLSK